MAIELDVTNQSRVVMVIEPDLTTQSREGLVKSGSMVITTEMVGPGISLARYPQIPGASFPIPARNARHRQLVST